jgi:hypothetical protein
MYLIEHFYCRLECQESLYVVVTPRTWHKFEFPSWIRTRLFAIEGDQRKVRLLNFDKK